MTTTSLPGGGVRYQNPTSGYTVDFPPGWSLNTSFPRHDFQATCSEERGTHIFGINVFTQHMPALEGQGPTDFLDNFGHGDFDGMVRTSFEEAFDIRPRGEVPVRQRSIGASVWFLGDYRLVGRSSGTTSELCYALTFARGYFYHFKAFLDPSDLPAASAYLEALLGACVIERARS